MKNVLVVSCNLYRRIACGITPCPIGSQLRILQGITHTYTTDRFAGDARGLKVYRPVEADIPEVADPGELETGQRRKLSRSCGPGNPVRYRSYLPVEEKDRHQSYINIARREFHRILVTPALDKADNAGTMSAVSGRKSRGVDR
ncbi:uncharacterized protein LOC143154857 [Ptiloglossa arizonensis]|uniref:uncharacterized protein LOC143154857 n=1 Tax=Ptiloglossa arizonensis TaxID=3350558 RepID=UPI003FA13DB2